MWLYKALVKQFIKQYGNPHLLHVHVMLRCGLVALYYKWVHKIPYVVTEQYSGYMPEAKGILRGVTPLNYWPLKLIAEHAEAVAPVSFSLASALRKSFNLKKVLVIPNTVVGPEQPGFKKLAAELGIGDDIKWFGETTQQTIAALMQRVSAQVLYSCFESFGCVNIEAIACGVPVIVSDLPVFREYLPQDGTAWFADGNDPSALADVLNRFINSGQPQSPIAVSALARPFNYISTGKMLCQLYARAIDK